MMIEIHPESYRTLVPITVVVSESSREPNILVKEISKGPSESFTVDTKPKDAGWQAQFWLQKAGDYEMTVSDGKETKTQMLAVTEQVFLPFQLEFGAFMVSFFAAGLGIFLWYRKIRTKKSV